MLVTGLAMLALDVFGSWTHRRTVASVTPLAKLGLFGLLAVWHGPLPRTLNRHVSNESREP